MAVLSAGPNTPAPTPARPQLHTGPAHLSSPLRAVLDKLLLGDKGGLHPTDEQFSLQQTGSSSSWCHPPAQYGLKLPQTAANKCWRASWRLAG